MGDVTTMTLSDFLLARIAEDEADARALSYNWNTSHEALRRRFVAECEAKRRIVEECRAVLSLASDWRTVEASDETDAILADHVLRALAFPYADRPGYREEWRP